MKKTKICIAVSVVLLFVIPLIVSFLSPLDRSTKYIKFFFFNVLYFLILGVHIGKGDEKKIYFILLALQLACIGDYLIWKENAGVFIEVAVFSYVICLAVALIGVFCSSFMHAEDKERALNYKKILLWPMLISGIFNCAGLLINLFSYVTTKDIWLAIDSSGGECTGKSGFGVHVLRSYPLTSLQESAEFPPEFSFELFEFLLGFFGLFMILFIIFMVYDIYSDKSADRKQNVENI